MSRRKPPRNRPLADPKRAPYVRAALARKQRSVEREACSGKDPGKHAATLAHLAACVRLVEDANA
jgi:hypothetical protein